MNKGKVLAKLGLVGLLLAGICGFGAAEQGSLFLIRQSDKWGYIDQSGKVVVTPQFYYAYPFSDGFARVGILPEGKVITSTAAITEILWYAEYKYAWKGEIQDVLVNMGYINEKGKVVIPPGQFDRCEDFSEGMAEVMLATKGGFIDNTGKIIINPVYESVWPFSQGLAAVRTTDKLWGFVDKTGTMVIKPQFDKVTRFSKGSALVHDSSGWNAIDTSGKVKVKLGDMPISVPSNYIPFSGGFEIRWKGKYTSQYIDQEGKTIPGKYHMANHFSDGLAAVWDEKSKSLGFIDKTGEIVIPAQFDKLVDFNKPWIFKEGLAAVMVGGKWGFIDKTGKIVIPAQFDEAQSFSEGFAVVKVGGKWGFIDNTGKYVVTPTYDGVNSFSNGLAQVFKNKKMNYIDKTGKLIWSEEAFENAQKSGKIKENTGASQQKTGEESKQKKCPFCSKLTSSDAKFCTECGKKLK